MLNSQLPAKWFKPFAADDAAKVEIPVTTVDPTRASQSLGFPPLTMQPPESGGVPPQGEDFNGAMNQVARFVWWNMAGGAIPYDNAYATNANINGYPQGAKVASADLQGIWVSLTDNNTINPDTVGTNWVPLIAYGTLSLTGLTNVNVTLTPAQAMKQRITLAGTLTGNIQIIVPTWAYAWTVVNNTTGAFTVTVKTAAGGGVVVPQSGLPVALVSDGTNVISNAPANEPGRLLRTSLYSRIAGVQNITVDGGTATTTGATIFTPLPSTAYVFVEALGAGGGSGGCAAQDATHVAVAGGGGGGAYGISRFSTGFSGVTVAAGLGGTAGAAGANAGGNGGSSSFGAILTAAGGNGGAAGVSNLQTASFLSPGALAGSTFAGSNIWQAAGSSGGNGINLGTASLLGGEGGTAGNGAGGRQGSGAGSAGGTAVSPGSGASGGAVGVSGAAVAGGSGGDGVVIVREYA